jgi:general L-amino acid transport system substrate-binding protein
VKASSETWALISMSQCQRKAHRTGRERFLCATTYDAGHADERHGKPSAVSRGTASALRDDCIGIVKMRGLKLMLASAGLVLAGVCSTRAGGMLEHVKSAGELSCGVVTEDYDYSKDDTHGNLTALGTDTCKGVAAAVLGEHGRLLVSAFPDEHHGLEAVESGKIALLAGATPRASTGARYSIGFGQPFFFDGQGFLVANTAGINSIGDLADKQICFIANTEAEISLAAALRKRNIKFLPFPFEEQGEMQAALVAGHCAAMTGNISQLANARATFHGRTDNFVILPDIITFDPLAPAFRRDDPQWETIVNWTIYAAIQAEASGVTRANVDTMSASEDPATNRLLTKAGGLGRALDLDENWAVHVIKAIGNYGEMFDRDVGQRSPLKLDRGMNALWTTKDGLMYPLPNR